MGCVVTVIDSKTSKKESEEAMKAAEILVSGVGKHNLITPDKISKGVILLDGGTSEGDGTSVGDIAFECEAKASFFARVPGGLGKLTVVSLFENLLLLKESRM
jgi:methylenetetrahydrofolate dehydrogenase (NADP+)/methenyltetrahydrofolate cyclohydrolase